MMMHGMEPAVPRREPLAPPADPCGFQRIGEPLRGLPRQSRHGCDSARMEYPDAVPQPAPCRIDPFDIPKGDFRGPGGAGQFEGVRAYGGGPEGIPWVENRVQDRRESGSPDRKVHFGARPGTRRAAPRCGGPRFPKCHDGPHMPWSRINRETVWQEGRGRRKGSGGHGAGESRFRFPARAAGGGYREGRRRPGGRCATLLAGRRRCVPPSVVRRRSQSSNADGRSAYAAGGDHVRRAPPVRFARTGTACLALYAPCRMS